MGKSFLKGTTTFFTWESRKSSPNIVFAETKFVSTVMCFVGLRGAADEACSVGILFGSLKGLRCYFSLWNLPDCCASGQEGRDGRMDWAPVWLSWAPCVWLHGGGEASHPGVGMPSWLQASQTVIKTSKLHVSSLLGPQLPQPRREALDPVWAAINFSLCSFTQGLTLPWDYPEIPLLQVCWVPLCVLSS